jgi:glycosyltransferase involved in cell wall biosynthesis
MSGMSEGDAVDRAMPLVSVVVTCFNQACFLADAIESVLAQSYPRREVLIVDDGSTDATAAVAQRYPVRYRWQPNAGLASARNAGIAATGGALLAFLDADDRLLPGALEAGVGCHRDHGGCGLVYGSYVYIDGAGRRIAAPVRRRAVGDAYAALLCKNHIGMHATVTYRRAALEQAGGFDPALAACEDHDVYLKIAAQQRIAWHDRLVAEYRRHGANMSNDHARMLAARLCVLRRHEAQARTRPDHRRAYRAGVRFAIAKSVRGALGAGVAALSHGRLAEGGGAIAGTLRHVWPWLLASARA